LHLGGATAACEFFVLEDYDLAARLAALGLSRPPQFARGKLRLLKQACSGNFQEPGERSDRRKAQVICTGLDTLQPPKVALQSRVGELFLGLPKLLAPPSNVRRNVRGQRFCTGARHP
jgi:hypothetical protein